MLLRGEVVYLDERSVKVCFSLMLLKSALSIVHDHLQLLRVGLAHLLQTFKLLLNLVEGVRIKRRIKLFGWLGEISDLAGLDDWNLFEVFIHHVACLCVDPPLPPLHRFLHRRHLSNLRKVTLHTFKGLLRSEPG